MCSVCVRACVRVYVRWCVVAQATRIASSDDARAGLPRNRRLGNYVSASFAVTAARRCRQYSGNVLRCSRESSGGARRDDVTRTVFLRRECPNTGVCRPPETGAQRLYNTGMQNAAIVSRIRRLSSFYLCEQIVQHAAGSWLGKLSRHGVTCVRACVFVRPTPLQTREC